MSQDLSPLLPILLALAVGAASPGPSFVMVAQAAVAASRRDGFAAALGMGAGGVVFALAALLGLHALLAAVPALHAAFRIVGGIYLVYLGWRIWCGAKAPLDLDGRKARVANPGRSFMLGLGTQLTNPKTAVFYASAFAAMLPPEIPPACFALLPLGVFGVEAGWYAFVALALSSPAPRTAYLGAKSLIDRIAGGVMAAFGLRLLLGSREN